MAVGLDGAVMRCQEATGASPLTKEEKSDRFCAWADHSTLAFVSPGRVEGDMSKDTAVEIIRKLRQEVRVKA